MFHSTIMATVYKDDIDGDGNVKRKHTRKIQPMSTQISRLKNAKLDLHQDKYTYQEYISSWLIEMPFHTCVRGQRWYKTRITRYNVFNEAKEKFENEKDLQTLLSQMCLTEYI